MLPLPAFRAADDPGGDSIYASTGERERAVRYSRTREWLAVVGLIWSASVSALVLVTGLSARLRSWSERIAPPRIGPVMPYAAVASLFAFLVELPLSFYSGYIVEHRYGLSNQSRVGWLVEQLKGLVVSLVVGVALLQGVYWVIARYPRRWWAIISGLTVPLSIVFVNLAPVLLMPLFNKFTPLKDRALAERITDLAAGQGVHVSEVLQMDMSKQTKKANAMFTGLGNTKRIVLGDTLLDEFTPDEVEVVLAHELGHQVHRDIWKLIALSAPVTVVGLFSAHRLAPSLLARWGPRWGLDMSRGLEDVASLPLLGLIMVVATQVVNPLLNAISRRGVEHPADRYALDLTGNNAAFISAMEKLGRINLANPRPSALVKYMFYSHPPLQERIDFGRRYRRSAPAD